ncbi:hypothetical protein HPB50_023232 [Hyalomma asiaticum]|uniref:Uncharacterized protein n=1 Tax=Hyalomma asiaticum TaxID=266040 RepID=A0ACB7SSB5_HYAAI|nr:hypothetical protein HPB50_023232 [Hyalomma asiaticum]
MSRFRYLLNSASKVLPLKRVPKHCYKLSCRNFKYPFSQGTSRVAGLLGAFQGHDPQQPRVNGH